MVPSYKDRLSDGDVACAEVIIGSTPATVALDGDTIVTRTDESVVDGETLA